jgi:hypothetical protein
MLPLPAAERSANLSGSVLSAADSSPLVGVKLHAGDPKTGEIYSSPPTTADGKFRIEQLPAATYRVAVESEGGLYVASAPVKLAPGQAQSLTVAVNPQMADDPQSAKGKQGPAKTSVWSNPGTAALIVLGASVVLGVAIDEATDDDDEIFASP